MSFSRLGVSASNLGNQDEALAYLERGAAILSELQAETRLIADTIRIQARYKRESGERNISGVI
jgi:hypothetical protein